MKIISYNVNGIRAAIKKGLLDWLQVEDADIYCLQEIKADLVDIDNELFNKIGYEFSGFSAQKKGYSGVALIYKKNINFSKVISGNGYEQSDAEGRVITAFHQNFTLINAYFPSGTSNSERQEYKYIWLDQFKIFIGNLLQNNNKLIILGDFNIAHTELDIHDPKGNKNTSGFLPEERQWLSDFLRMGLLDSYRNFHPGKSAGYTWWSQRFPSVRLQNKGWRIDYVCVSNSLSSDLKNAFILPEVKHSDHCPCGIELN